MQAQLGEWAAASVDFFGVLLVGMLVQSLLTVRASVLRRSSCRTRSTRFWSISGCRGNEEKK